MYVRLQQLYLQRRGEKGSNSISLLWRSNYTSVMIFSFDSYCGHIRKETYFSFPARRKKINKKDSGFSAILFPPHVPRSSDITGWCVWRRNWRSCLVFFGLHFRCRCTFKVFSASPFQISSKKVSTPWARPIRLENVHLVEGRLLPNLSIDRKAYS